MIRFIELADQIDLYPEEHCIAWFDTVTDKFLEYNGTHTWDCWKDFEGDYEGNNIERFKTLFPYKINL